MPPKLPSSAAGTPASIRDFVRHELGCGCPAAVLAAIRRTNRVAYEPAGCSYDRIDVGRRLLIYVLHDPGSGAEVERLRALLHAGKRERDELAFNRFRLVLAVDPGDEATAEAAQAAWTGLEGKDERVHVHVVLRQRVVGV